MVVNSLGTTRGFPTVSCGNGTRVFEETKGTCGEFIDGYTTRDSIHTEDVS